MFRVILICALISLGKCSEHGEYYWKPWTPGSPPSDAISGLDYRGRSYIVEAYAANFGEFTGQVFANQHDVNVSALHVNTTLLLQNSHSIKVLCSQNKDKLAWYPTDYKTLKNELITGTINPVLGGYNSLGELLYVGRYIDYSLRTVFFGSVCNLFHVHYHYSGKAYTQPNFEILVIEDNKCNN